MYHDQNRSGTDLSRLQIGLNWPGQIMLQVWISCSRLLLAAPGCSWLLLAAHGCSWLLLAAPGCSWLLLAAPGCSWLLLAAPGCSWLLLATDGCCWLVLAAGLDFGIRPPPQKPFKILSNIYQNQTFLRHLCLAGMLSKFGCGPNHVFGLCDV